jgi:hypothetical protein
MDDLIHIYETAIADARLSGPVNACSPEPVRFRALLDHLRIYHKAIVVPLPVALVRPFIKDLANELTNSQRVIPAKLTNMQFHFEYGNLKKALEAIFK